MGRKQTLVDNDGLTDEPPVPQIELSRFAQGPRSFLTGHEDEPEALRFSRVQRIVAKQRQAIPCLQRLILMDHTGQEEAGAKGTHPTTIRSGIQGKVCRKFGLGGALDDIAGHHSTMVWAANVRNGSEAARLRGVGTGPGRFSAYGADNPGQRAVAQ